MCWMVGSDATRPTTAAEPAARDPLLPWPWFWGSFAVTFAAIVAAAWRCGVFSLFSTSGG